MTIAQTVPRILEHLDTEQWQRPSRLLVLVAINQSPPLPCPVSPRLIQATGRSARQAKYDHGVMCQMADNRILRRWRGRGRQPDLWAINPRLREWRNVPWITRRRDVLAAFSGLMADEAVALWAITAGQMLGVRTVEAFSDVLADYGLSANDLTSTQLHMTTTQRSLRVTGAPPVLNATDVAPAHYLPSNYSLSLPTPPPNPGREGDGNAAKAQAVQLARAISDVIGCPVTGQTNLDCLTRLVEDNPDRFDELLTLTDKLAGFRYATAAVPALVQLAAKAPGRPVAPPPDPAARAANLRDLIATYEAQGVEPDKIEVLRSQLADLGAS